MIPVKTFGRSAHKSTRTIFGAFALSSINQKEADQVLELLFKFGINHIDTAPSYGESEIRIGPWMKQHRDKFFLATKTEGRTYKTAMAELNQSFQRMNVDSVDLWQMHNLINEEQWETALSPGGAIDALVEAKKQGMTKYIGVTGHGLAAPKRHLETLKRYDLDTVLLPYNFILMQNPKYASDFEELAKVCKERNVAIQTIKGIAKGLRPHGAHAHHNTWYAPITNQESIQKSVDWILGNEDIFLNTSGDKILLEQLLNAANNLNEKPSFEAMLALMKDEGIKPMFKGDEI